MEITQLHAIVYFGTELEMNSVSGQPEIPSSNLTAAQVSNPPLPALYCLHEGCIHVYTVYTPIGKKR